MSLQEIIPNLSDLLPQTALNGPQRISLATAGGPFCTYSNFPTQDSYYL